MPSKPVVLTSTIGFRLTAEEHAEISTFLDRSGQKQSEFVRNAVLAKVRGATAFAELLPSLAASIEREVLELRKTLEVQSGMIRTLTGASIATAAFLHAVGAKSDAEAEGKVDDAVARAIRAAPMVVDRCLEIHPQLRTGGAE